MRSQVPDSINRFKEGRGMLKEIQTARLSEERKGGPQKASLLSFRGIGSIVRNFQRLVLTGVHFELLFR